MKRKDLAYSRALVVRRKSLLGRLISILGMLFVIALIIVCLTSCQKETDTGDKKSGDGFENLHQMGIEQKKEIGKDIMEIDYAENCTFSITYPETGDEKIDKTIKEIVNHLKDDFTLLYTQEEGSKKHFFQHITYESKIEEENKLYLLLKEMQGYDEDILLNEYQYEYYFDLQTGDLLSSNIPKREEQTTPSGEQQEEENVRYATADVNVREGPAVSYKRLGLLRDGEKVVFVAEEENGWTKVLYQEQTGYIKTDYLSLYKIIHKIVEPTIVDRGIDKNKPMVAITFDDGPNPIATPRILDVLEENHAVATFFDLGQLVNRFPEIVQREEALQCEVGNHTYSHANLNLLSKEELQEEIKNSEDAFINALGHKTTLFRPAYGNANHQVKEMVEYPLITWNVDSLDWKYKNKQKILDEIRKIKNFDGKIILLHSIYGTTADAAEVLIPELIDKGYQLVTVSELAYYKGYTLETGKVYTNF